MAPVIEVADLHKSYGEVHAVNGISFTVEAGECVAVLGPNGAGKTTTIEMLEGFRAPDTGTARARLRARARRRRLPLAYRRRAPGVRTILTVLVTGLGVVAYGVTFPGRYLGLVVVLVVGAFCFGGIGALVATLVPDEDAAAAMINFVLFPVLFISGTFGRVEATSTVGRIAQVFPVWHLNQLLEAVFNPYASGTGLVAGHLGVLVLWGVGSLALATRRFRWEPSRT